MKGSLARLFIALAAITIAIIFGAAAITAANVIGMRSVLANITGETLERVELSGQVNTDLFRGLAEALIYARTGSQDARASARQEMSDAAELTDRLGESEAGAVAFEDADADFAALQERRRQVVGAFRPSVEDLLAAVDRGDPVTIRQALEKLDSVTASIEQLEEDSGAVADRAIQAAGSEAESAAKAVFLSLAGAMAALLIVAPIVIVIIQRGVVRPLAALAASTRAVAAGDLGQTVEATGRHEVGELQQAFNQMVRALAAAQDAVAEQQRLLEARVAERTAELSGALDEVRRSSSEREELLATVRQLASPVIPVAEGVLVMPLIGVLDDDRAAAMTETLLHAVQQHRARQVIMDVTGVPLIDTSVARTLLDASASVRLLGTRTMLVGLRPELAQTIVGLGLDLSSIETAADLQGGLRVAMVRG